MLYLIKINHFHDKLIKCELEFDSSYSDGQFRKQANNSKMLELFPDFEFTSLQFGLEKTIDHFIENYSTLRIMGPPSCE
uniref:Uncharacterized protein n=1 Tax=viral metagenome TaxID=1070528 RepID=A0A6C0I9Z3_9ZZZZ